MRAASSGEPASVRYVLGVSLFERERVSNVREPGRVESCLGSSMCIVAGICLVVSACGTTARQVEPRVATSAVAASPGQLAMRSPDDLQAPSDRLGTMRRTPVATLDSERAAPVAHRSAPRVAPIRVADDPRPRRYPLQDDKLVLPSGLVVHRVPKGVSVSAARDRQTGDVVLEIADTRGRRLALLKERSFRRAASASAPVLDETTTVRFDARRDDWGGSPVRVIVERFRAEHHIYTLERRATGTDWISRNLELTNGGIARRTD